MPAPPFRLRRYLREPLVVPETKPLNQLVDEFREEHAHMAMVVDEFGTFTGLVTLEDVLEQIFGQIGDEHDVRRPPPVGGRSGDRSGRQHHIRDLASEYGSGAAGRRGLRNAGRIPAVPPRLYSRARRIGDLRLAHIHRAGRWSATGSRRVKIVTARPAEAECRVGQVACGRLPIGLR